MAKEMVKRIAVESVAVGDCFEFDNNIRRTRDGVKILLEVESTELYDHDDRLLAESTLGHEILTAKFEEIEGHDCAYCEVPYGTRAWLFRRFSDNTKEKLLIAHILSEEIIVVFNKEIISGSGEDTASIIKAYKQALREAESDMYLVA